MHGVGSRNKLRASHARLYPGDGVLDVLGRAVCVAGCLPRKEVHEAFEMALRVRERFAGGRVVDLCAGFGLLAQALLILDDSSPEAVAVDVKLPKNAGKVHDAIALAFPRLRGRVRFEQLPLSRMPLAAGDVVVSSHACGPLTDDVLQRAADAGARVAVLPCCHQHRWREDLQHVDDPSLVIDLARIAALQQRGYAAWTASIPEAVSPKNRLLFGAPA